MILVGTIHEINSSLIDSQPTKLSMWLQYGNCTPHRPFKVHLCSFLTLDANITASEAYYIVFHQPTRVQSCFLNTISVCVLGLGCGAQVLIQPTQLGVHYHDGR